MLKKIFILAGLGLLIVIIYKQVVLKPQTAETPEATPSATSGSPPLTDTAVPVYTPGVKPEVAVSTATKVTSSDVINQAWGRDPFLGEDDGSPVTNPDTTINPPPPKPVIEEDLLMLTGIAWQKNKALAIINGQVVHEGEYVYIKGKKTYQVITILKNRVMLKANEKTITLRVKGG